MKTMIRNFTGSDDRALDFVKVITLPDSACPPQAKSKLLLRTSKLMSVLRGIAQTTGKPQPQFARIYFDDSTGVRYRYALSVGGVVIRQYADKAKADNVAATIRAALRRDLRSYAKQQLTLATITAINTH